jgi:hypothetical protein
MAAKQAMLEDVSFVAEGLTGTACASALRKVKSLAEAAPRGRAFAAISTLTELGRRIETALEAGNEALSAQDDDTAALELARAVVLMDRMAAEAKSENMAPASEPSYLKRRRVHFDM